VAGHGSTKSTRLRCSKKLSSHEAGGARNRLMVLVISSSRQAWLRKSGFLSRIYVNTSMIEVYQLSRQFHQPWMEPGLRIVSAANMMNFGGGNGLGPVYPHHDCHRRSQRAIYVNDEGTMSSASINVAVSKQLEGRRQQRETADVLPATGRSGLYMWPAGYRSWNTAADKRGKLVQTFTGNVATTISWSA